MRTLGEVQKWHSEERAFNLQGEGFAVRLQLVNDQALRVQMAQTAQEFNDFSYSVQQREVQIFPEIRTTEYGWQIPIGTCTLELQKAPFRLALYAPDGSVLLEDEPGLGTVVDGREWTCYKKRQKGERFLGLGEKTGNLDRRGQVYTNWNTDQFGYHNGTDPLYASFPFYLGVVSGHSYGLFLDNSSRTEFNFGASSERYSYFRSEQGGLDYYLFYGGAQNLAPIVQQYTALTGRSPLPPKWALGFQQCRYSYFPDTEVSRVAATFREKDLPADVLYLDIHYMQDYKVFTWHEERFAKPEHLLEQLHQEGFEVVTIVDPGVKVEDDYDIYESGKAQDVFVKYLDGQPYEGGVWPGICHFPDFTAARVREWWGQQFGTLVKPGVRGFWNDMNEPAVWGNSFPDVTRFERDGEGGTHKNTHNVYGLQMARATYEGARRHMPKERPFVLTRSAFSGIQNYAALWTGDNVANEEHLFLGTRLINSLGLTGVWFCGNDIGGFIGDVSADVFVRWLQVGAFSPFFRCHSMVNSRSAEPWTFGESATEIARNYIKLRYRIMPYLYSEVQRACNSGIPVHKPLAFNYPQDALCYHPQYQNQFLIGDSWLVVPCSPGQQFTRLYLPKGQWYDLYNDALLEGEQELVYETPLYKLPIFVKAGAVLPMVEPGRNVYDRQAPAMEWHLYPGAESGQWHFYDDDGRSYAYAEGASYQRTVRWDAETETLTLEAAQGSYALPEEHLRLYWHGEAPLRLFSEGKELVIQKKDYRMVQPLSSFDPWEQAPDESMVIHDLPYVELPLSSARIVVEHRRS